MKKIPIALLTSGALLTASTSAQSAVLLNENFTSTDGAFVETAVVGAPASPWAYNNAFGTWESAGAATGPVEDELATPEVTMPAANFLRVTLVHRYNFEKGWDGGAIQYSVDGGEWLDVAPIDFVQNGYAPPVIGTGSLKNKPAFNGQSAGYATPAYITSIVDIPQQAAGAVVKVRFLGAWDESFAEGAPNWEITSVQLESLTDTDSDGMPDVYEDAHAGLDKTINDAAADADIDGSSNLTEFQKHTNPILSDTDGDGYKDGVETETATWASATDTGTNPLDPDTDGDGLLDGVENPTLAFTGPTQAGSDPTVTDSDADGWDDKTEVVFAGNPKLAATTPALPAAPLHVLATWNFNDASKPASAVDQSHGFRGKLGGRAVYGADASGRTGAAGDRALDLGPVQLAGTGMSLPAATFLNFTGVNDQACISFWQKLDSVSSSFAFFAKNGTNPGGDTRGLSAHATWSDNNFYWDTAGCCNGAQRLAQAKPASLNLTTAWHHIIFQKNGPLKEIWIDGVLVGTQTGAAPLPVDFISLFVGSGDSGGANTQGLIDDFTVFAESLNESQILSLANGSSPLTLLDDSDGDGMLDNYETANGLNKNSALDRDSDLDFDGVTNFQEYTRGTKANNPDSDGDTLSDGVESGTGTWVSATNRGTNPLKIDSDSDGWSDNVETNTGTYANATDTGTNPNKLDTDGDTISDPYEVNILATSPFNPAVPVLGAGTGIGISFTGDTAIPGITPSEIAGFAPVSQLNWNISDGAPTGGTVNITGPVSGKLVNAAGVETTTEIAWDSANIYNATNGDTTGNSKLMNGYLDTNATTGEHVDLTGIPYPVYDVYVYFGSDGNGRSGSIANLGSGEEYFYVTASARGTASGFQYHHYFATNAITSAAGGDANFMVFRNQSSAALNLQVNRGSNNSGIHAVQIVPIADTDGDGMSDAYEDANGLDKTSNTDRDSDKDLDGLSNLVEFKTHTRANVKDTDGDGFQDNVETGTGAWVSAGNTGSHPLKSDSDGDGLPDGIEVRGAPFLGLNQPGSDPNLKDSDSDTWDDYTEAAYGGHPLQDTSIPTLDSAPLHLLAWWPYDDASNPALAMDVTHSLPGTFRNGAAYSVDGGGRTGQPGDRSLDLTTNQTAGREMYVPLGLFQNLAAAQDQVTLSFWQKLTAIEASTVFKGIFTPGDGTDNRALSAHATWSDSNFYWDTAGCCNNPGQRLAFAKPAEIDMTQWHHFAFVKNGLIKEIWVDGVLLVSQEGANPLPVSLYEFHVGGVNGGESIKGFIDDFAFFAEGLTESQIQALAAGATPASLLKSFLPITNVSFNNAARNLTLTFDSAAGKQYIIERSADLATWVPLTSTHPSAGISTSYVDAALPTTATRYFYRVSEAP